MNARLKDSLETAEDVLSDDARDRLALFVQAFTATERGRANEHFFESGLAELRAEANTPFEAADPEKVRAIFERNGVTLN